jgi:pyruvate carboxylase
MNFTGLLAANRGEMAFRIIRAATDLSLKTVAVCSEDGTSRMGSNGRMVEWQSHQSQKPLFIILFFA